MPGNITPDSPGAPAMSQAGSWMLYGAAGSTGALIAQHACTAPAITALAERLDLPHRAVALDDPAALHAALAGVDLVLNAADPFLQTAAPLAEACLAAGVHYLDIGNELQVFRTLLRPGPACPAGRRDDHARGRVRRRRHQLPRPSRQRRRRRRSDPRNRHPGRHLPARPRPRGRCPAAPGRGRSGPSSPPRL
jgi:Saccharopine dehydrogenase NADP binding domain